MDYFKCVFFSIIFISSICGTTAAESISCKDDKGRNVDWFYAYKLPKRVIINGKKSNGLEFLFITSRSNSNKNDEWILSEQNIDETTSLIGHTIVQGFSSKDRLVIAYNDEPPLGRVTASKGHTKGLLVASDKSGFWLIHSVPLFPQIHDNADYYSFPQTGQNYGQSFVCVSVRDTEIDRIGTQLSYNQPHMYVAKITSDLRKKYLNISALIDKRSILQAPYYHTADIRSSDGTIFKSFAKHRKFNRDLYEDLVAPELKTDLFAETWRHGRGMMPSNCTQKFKVWNISGLKFDKLTFRTTEDHSKWVVSNEAPSNWICVGDINRSKSQEKRGGGTLCQHSKAIAGAYRSAIQSFEPCERKEHS